MSPFLHLVFDSKYYLVFHNSLQAAIILSLRSENAWFAAFFFGTYNMAPVTAAAFLGSTIGMLLNYGAGFYISRWRKEVPAFSEHLYQRVARFFARRGYLFMLIPPISLLEMIPGFGLFALVNGLFRVPPGKAIAVIAAARVIYYAYYLFF